MRLPALFAFVFTFALTGCAGISPQSASKSAYATLKAWNLAQDSFIAYGTAPNCPQPLGLCKDSRNFADLQAKESLITAYVYATRPLVASGSSPAVIPAAFVLAAWDPLVRDAKGEATADESVPQIPPTLATISAIAQFGVLADSATMGFQEWAESEPTLEDVLGLMDQMKARSGALEAVN